MELVVAPIIIMLGPSGAGKSEQAKRLAKARDLEYISSGDLLRASRDPAIQADLRAGRLVESHYAEQLVLDRLKQVDPGRGILLDGFPRQLSQAKWLEDQLPALGRKLTRVIHLMISREQAEARLRRRGRDDDSEAVWAEKWRAYDANTRAAAGYFGHQGLGVEIDGMGTLDEVAGRIEAAL
jgi:adenylate kinase